MLLDLLATISVQQQDNLQLKESLNESIVEARSSKMELRKELTQVVLKTKYQSAMQRKDKAVSAMSRISERKLNAENSKSLSQSLDLLATISVQQQDNLQLKESLNESIVEARSSKMELRKELTQEIVEKKITISSMTKELKAVNTILACVRRHRVSGM